MLNELSALIEQRKKAPLEGSYTCNLFDRGEDVILKKVGEEAMEVILAAKGQGQPPTTLKSQARETSPRQACAGKERYALLQCMETQCAKKAWTRHEQCVRLRKEHKL